MKGDRYNYLKYLNPLELLQTKKVLQSNPNVLKVDKLKHLHN